MATKLTFLAITLALVAAIGNALRQDKKAALPTEHTPQIILATAKDANGEVVLRLVNHQRLSFSEIVKGQAQTYDALVTSEADVNLEEVSLTTKAGKPLEKADVLKRLSKQAKALLFVFEADPYYVDFFRDDIVVINAKGNTFEWKQVAKKKIAD